MVSTSLYKSIILAALFIALVFFARSLMMPIIFSAMVAMFLHPTVRFLETKGFNLGIASFLVVLIFSAVVVAIIWFTGREGVRIVSELPKENIEKFVDKPIEKVDDQVDMDLNVYTAEIDKVITGLKEKLVELLPGMFKYVNNSIVFFITCPLYIFFMLLCRSSIRKFYYISFKPNKRQIAHRILRQIEMVYMRYLKGLLLVMTIVGVLTGIGLALLGIEYPIFIGAITGLLTLIPFLGVFVSALIPVMIALLTKDSLWYPAGVIAIYVAIQFVEGNIITPKVMGEQVGINPLMVILGIVIFGTIGGITGMLLTVPLLALIKTVAFYIPGWKPLRALLQVSG